MTRHLLPQARRRAPRSDALSLPGGHLSALSVALVLALGVASTDANALALGRLAVQSALGEPLRAEVDVTQISPDEADGLRVGLAPVEAFRAAGIGYDGSTLSDLRVSLQRRADGRYVVRITGTRPVNDPFLDLLLEANWHAGRIVRDYTVLLDPPGSRPPAATPDAGTAPSFAAAPLPRYEPPEAPMVRGGARRARAAAPARPAPPADVSPRGTGRAAGSGEQVIVQRGDTASRIAAAHKSADISLDQMLVALLRANPDAFIGGNINRMKTGAMLQLPTAAEASATPADEARRTVTAQSHDFSNYRQRLAEYAPATQLPEADRQASGKLEAKVQEGTAPASPDKLTLSQGSLPVGGAEQQLAQSRQLQQDNARVAELNKNLSDLNKLHAASAPVATTTPALAAPALAGASAAVPAATPVAPPANTPTAGAAASAASAATPASAAAALPPPAIAKLKPKPSTPPPQPGFFDDLLSNPLMQGLGALIVALLGFLLYRVFGRKRPEAGESVFLESRMPKDSFFGANGGESVDTKERSSAMSSLTYSPSQLDAGDVDPVAEADVYLAYGRDLQAEEILREALRNNPQRVAIYLKLLEIHAKRRDRRAFEALATETRTLTDGAGNDWMHVIQMGRELDPGNPLYQTVPRSVAVEPATAPAVAGGVAPTVASATAAVAVAAAATPTADAPPPAFVPSVAPLDFDLDLGKPETAAQSAGARAGTEPPAAAAPEPFLPTQAEMPRTLPPAVTPSGAEPAINGAAGLPSLDLSDDFDTAPGTLAASGAGGAPSRAQLAERFEQRASLIADDVITQPAALEPARPAEDRTQPATLRAGLPGDTGFIEFDMSRMDAGTPLRTQPGHLEGGGEAGENPHAIKLSLARELHALGDTEAARSLVQEVASETTGPLQAQAQQLLAQLV